jgi:hypothetical protein
MVKEREEEWLLVLIFGYTREDTLIVKQPNFSSCVLIREKRPYSAYLKLDSGSVWERNGGSLEGI